MKIILTIFSLIILSCNRHSAGNEPNEYAARFVRELNTSDTLRNEIIPDQNEYWRLIDSAIKTQSLENGFDSIEIRFWYGCPIGCKIPWFLLSLRNQKNKWNAQFTTLKMPKEDSFIWKTDYRRPKSGWTKFIDTLFTLKILELEDQRKVIPDYKKSSMDGSKIMIELATKNTIRQYSYDDPGFGELDKYWQLKNIDKILKFIKKELDIDYD